jgi:hypothetical protein
MKRVIAAAMVTVTTGAGVTMSSDPDQPQVLIQCRAPGTVALELRDTWGNPVLRLNCPQVPQPMPPGPFIGIAPPEIEAGPKP